MTEMTDEEMANFAVQTAFEFYPKFEDDAVPDEQGRATAEVAMRTVAFGMGDDPKVLLAIEAAECGAKLTATVSDMDLDQLSDLLEMALMATREAIEQDLRARIDAQQSK